MIDEEQQLAIDSYQLGIGHNPVMWTINGHANQKFSINFLTGVIYQENRYISLQPELSSELNSEVTYKVIMNDIPFRFKIYIELDLILEFDGGLCLNHLKVNFRISIFHMTAIFQSDNQFPHKNKIDINYIKIRSYFTQDIIYHLFYLKDVKPLLFLEANGFLKIYNYDHWT